MIFPHLILFPSLRNISIPKSNSNSKKFNSDLEIRKFRDLQRDTTYNQLDLKDQKKKLIEEVNNLRSENEKLKKQLNFKYKEFNNEAQLLIRMQGKTKEEEKNAHMLKRILSTQNEIDDLLVFQRDLESQNNLLASAFTKDSKRNLELYINAQNEEKYNLSQELAYKKKALNIFNEVLEGPINTNRDIYEKNDKLIKDLTKYLNQITKNAVLRQNQKPTNVVQKNFDKKARILVFLDEQIKYLTENSKKNYFSKTCPISKKESSGAPPRSKR